MVFQERTYSVLLVSAGDKFARTLMALLPPSHYWPVTAVKTAGEARRALAGQAYDLVLINAPLPDDFGSQLASDICGRSDAAVLLFVGSELFQEVSDQATERGILTLPKPTSTQMITHFLRVLCAVRERMRHMEEKQASVEEKIREIRLVNRAKWALIQCLSMSEEEAHRYIEKQAMDHRISKREAALQVLATYHVQET